MIIPRDPRTFLMCSLSRESQLVRIITFRHHLPARGGFDIDAGFTEKINPL